MKKIIQLILSLTMMLSLAACTQNATEEKKSASYQAGTYSQTVTGRNGKMVVDVTFSESSIESVTISEHSETQSVASVAMERIPSQIVEHQTTNVDFVTGATITSAAIVGAVKAAVQEAKGDQSILDAVTTAKSTAQEAFTKNADVIVVGGGGAGMSAAVAAIQEGASVILIEKTSMLGGNTVLCGGAMNAVDAEWEAQFEAQTGEKETLANYVAIDEADVPEAYLEDFRTLKQQINDYLANNETYHFDSEELHTIQTWYHGLRTDLDGNAIYGNYELVSTMTENANDAVLWLQDLGVQWDTSKATQPVGAMWIRGHNPSMPKGTEYVAVLEPIILEKGEILYETSATELIVENGEVTGVKVVQADGTEGTLTADKGVILATGGYGANLSMVQEYNNYWESIPDDTKTTNASGQKGEGITMALSAGAAVTGMEFAQMMPVSDPVSGDLFTGLIPQTASDYIFFNTEGKRFINECEARDTLTIAALANGGTFYMLADAVIAEDCRWLTDWEVEVENGRTLMADTLEELAALMGYDEAQTAAFLEEVEKYNSYVDAGNDPEFGKSSLNHKVETGPFYATPRKPAVHHTMGGLVIDVDAHVLDANNEIITGLFAAGEVTGGIHGGNRLGGNAVADIMVFGKIAGTNAASIQK